MFEAIVITGGVLSACGKVDITGLFIDGGVDFLAVTVGLAFSLATALTILDGLNPKALLREAPSK
jgi:hypothetical protein